MVEERIYNTLKDNYGKDASWCIWNNPQTTNKEDVGDLSIFEDKELYKQLNKDYVFIGFCKSEQGVGPNETNKLWYNFHSPSPNGNDYKLRYALYGTKFWGSYITDVVKDRKTQDQDKVLKELKNKDRKKEVRHKLMDELKIFESKPILIAIGKNAFDFIDENLVDYKRFRIDSFANYGSAEKYRRKIEEQLKI